MSEKPLAEGLYRIVDGGPRLLGARRKSDGRFVFPAPQNADSALYETVELASEGALWSYTVQRFRPKPPYAGPDDGKAFRPYAVGYVELAGQIIVESHIKTDDFSTLKIGMPMRLTLIPFRQDGDGALVMTYAFEAAGPSFAKTPKSQSGAQHP